MERVDRVILPLLTRLNEGFGKLKSGYDHIDVRPLIRVPEPTKGYIEIKTYTHGLRDEGQWEAIKKFYQKFKEYSEPNEEYISKLLRIRDHNSEYAEIALARDEVSYMGEGLDPIERKETKAGSKWMLLVDFDFFRVEGRAKKITFFIPLMPEKYFQGYPFTGFQWPHWLIKNVKSSKKGEIPPWTKIEEVLLSKTLEPEEAEEFEKKREIAKAKIRYPYKED